MKNAIFMLVLLAGILVGVAARNPFRDDISGVSGQAVDGAEFDGRVGSDESTFATFDKPTRSLMQGGGGGLGNPPPPPPCYYRDDDEE